MLVTQGDSPITTTRVGYSDVGWKSLLIGMRKGEELKAPRHASAAATRDGSLPYLTATCLIPDTSNSSFMVAIYI
jgi:hypothetical protein